MKSREFFIDAAAVFLCCIALAFIVCNDNIVTVLLIFIIGTAFLLLLNGKLLYAAEILVPAVSLVLPEAVVFIPEALYISAGNKHKIPLTAETLLLVISISENGFRAEFLCTAVLAVLAVTLGFRSEKLALLNIELIKTRDSDTELAMALQEKNKELLRKQDDEVNIATLKERNRIAREIHDNVGHLLSRALLQSGALLAITDKEKMPAQYAQTSALKETLGSAMNSIRESVHGLRDDSIDLRHAVKEAADSVSGKFKVRTELDFSEKMPAKVKLCFIAVVKEALSNAVKYSNGDTVDIVIREHPALYQLCVTDNGKNAEIGHGSGMGLNNMRERAEALGGIFRADTSDGFRIFISVKRDTGGNANENSSGR